MRLHYKIVGIHEDHPDKPTVYRGEFTASEEEPCLTALATQFGEPGKFAVDCLQEWSGGEVKHWAEDMDDEPNAYRWEVFNDVYTYHIFIGAGPLE